MAINMLLPLGICLGAVIIGLGSRFVFKSLKDDNPIEELCEDVIKSQTGVDIDLTPESPEKPVKTTQKKKVAKKVDSETKVN